MRKDTLSTAVTLCAAAALLGAMGTASAAPGASRTVTPQPGQPVLVDCFWHGDVRPTDFVLACGDGNSVLSSLHWSRWDNHSALAEGVNAVNDCKPYCAAGTFRSYPVVVRLDRPQSWKKHPQTQHYTRLSLFYINAAPEGFARVATYPLWN